MGAADLTLKTSMQIATQLSVFLANEPGTLAEVCELLSRERINIFGLTVSDTTDHSVVRMVTSDPSRTSHLLGERGVLVVENKVLLLENSNKPGEFGAVARKLAKAKINIEYAYLATSPGAKKGLAVFRVSDTKKAAKLLGVEA